MIEFKMVELSDKSWMDPLLFKGNMRGCEHNFVNTFIWAETYQEFVAQVDNYLVVRVGHPGKYRFLYPAGSGDIRPVIERMKAFADAEGCPFMMMGVTPENKAELDVAFPGRFAYTEMRDNFDYLYLAESLATLAGKKLHAKRNHINRFVENNPDWSFEPITLENIAECRLMSEEWCRLNGCAGDRDLAAEACAVRQSFNHFFAMELEGGLIRAGGRVIAFTMGDRLSADTYDVHIEKAFGEIQGAYPIINREFARYIRAKYPEIIYLNREEDMGVEGLRHAKLSYDPVMMVEKHLAVWSDEPVK